MTTLKELATKTGQTLRKLETQAAAHGFTGAPTDELPAGIEAKLTGPRQIGNAPNSEQSEPQPTPEPPKGQGLGDIYGAFYASTENLQQSQFEMEKEAAIAQGRMLGHQLYLNLTGAKNETLQTLVQRDLERSLGGHQEKAGDYRDFVEDKRQKALQAWAASDKQGKTLKQAFAEMKALNASFDI